MKINPNFSPNVNVSTDNIPEKSENLLNQKNFLNIMMTQMTNQNPLEPKENGEFLSQMAQFSMVSGITELNINMSHMRKSFEANQRMQATSMLGRHVLVPASEFTHEKGDSVSGKVTLLSSADNVDITIYNESNKAVRKINTDYQSAGIHDWSWDGKNDSGNDVPKGKYRIAVEVSRDGSRTESAATLFDKVKRVVFGQGGEIELELTKQSSINFHNVKQIY